MMNPHAEVDFKRIKAELLCYGARIAGRSREVTVRNYPLLLEESYIHGAHVTIGGNIPVNVCFGEAFTAESPYELDFSDGRYFFTRYGTPCCDCSLLPEPKWYRARTIDGAEMRDLYRVHGRNVLADSTFVRCTFIDEAKACLFCSFPKDRISEEWKLSKLDEVIATALDEHPTYSIALSEGARADETASCRYFKTALMNIRAVAPNIEVSVEMIAPVDLSIIDCLVDTGATALIMNLEFQDADIRRVFCPGKSRVSREVYRRAWDRAVTRLGAGRVSSVLIAGIERERLTIEAATEMISIGVIPTIIPFRPYDNCALRNMRTTSPEVLLAIEDIVGGILRNAGLDPHSQGGCASCGACSLEGEFCMGDVGNFINIENA